MTPNDIEVLLHCHTCPSVHPRFDAQAVIESLDMFLDSGIIQRGDGDLFTTTDKGKALVSILCDTPFPTPAWISQSGKVVRI